MIPRTLGPHLRSVAAGFPVTYLTGPRQSGKTTLARHAFPERDYSSLEDPQTREEAREDPRGFLARLARMNGAIIDEAQHAPDLFSYIQGEVDAGRLGPLLLTGSQNFLLSERISQSLAGRVAVLELLPFSRAELDRRRTPPPEEVGRTWADPAPGEARLESVLLDGGFPPIHDRSPDRSTWFEGYVRTYLERDVRSLAAIGDLQTFHRFLRLCAGRSGQLLNASALGADAGVDQTTARRWLSILEASYVIRLVSPHHANFKKRLVKTPKIFFLDTGLLCHLLGVRTADDLEVHPLRGAVFETWVAGELCKAFLHQGRRPPVFFWRDRSGHEVDFILEQDQALLPIEAKSGQTIHSDSFSALHRYRELSGCTTGALIYGGDDSYERQGWRLQSWRGL